MNQFEMVAIIVVAVMLAGVLRARYGYGRKRRSGRDDPATAEDNAEASRLRDEVRQLKERLAVLERITVEKESTLEREIERLRDR